MHTYTYAYIHTYRHTYMDTHKHRRITIPYITVSIHVKPSYLYIYILSTHNPQNTSLLHGKPRPRRRMYNLQRRRLSEFHIYHAISFYVTGHRLSDRYRISYSLHTCSGAGGAPQHRARRLQSILQSQCHRQFIWRGSWFWQETDSREYPPGDIITDVCAHGGEDSQRQQSPAQERMFMMTMHRMNRGKSF